MYIYFQGKGTYNAVIINLLLYILSWVNIQAEEI